MKKFKLSRRAFLKTAGSAAAASAAFGGGRADAAASDSLSGSLENSGQARNYQPGESGGVDVISVRADELSEAKRWTAAKFKNKLEAQQPTGYLMGYMKFGQIRKNQVDGHPLIIVNKQYRRGLFCPSEGQIVVHLPSEAKSFQAIVGVDSNRVSSFYSSAGRGRVIASVQVNGKEAFRSDVMREGMAGVPVRVDLEGSREFTLGMADGGGGTVFGNDFDQTDWGEARVSLSDGRTIWLGDLPLGPLGGHYTAEPPFSFRYGGRPSSVLLKAWERNHSEQKLDEYRTEHMVVYKDPETGLEVRCVAVEYSDFPAVEWTLHFKNTSDRPTPILEDVLGLDTKWERNGEGEFILHHSKGAPVSPTDYRPYETPMGLKTEKRISAAGGRPTNSDLCYFNVEWPGQGVIIAVGWPGQWAAKFTRDDDNGLRVEMGQELTHFKLMPGEEARTPLTALLFWKGDWIRSQNIWRRWMIAHNLPRPGGKLVPPLREGSSAGQYIEMQQADEQNQQMFIDRYLEEGLKIDYWWMDAGWYPFKGGWWNVGTWEPDPARFPHGLRAVSDHAHAKGVKILVWFEPERVTSGTWLYENHPEWLLGDGGEQKLLNLGDPEAFDWLVNHLETLITGQGIDFYRTDFNIDPLPFWRAHDAPDRQGITENKYVTNFLGYFDRLRQRYPNMPLDTCASGGRRNDLETLRRAVPLSRSDYGYELTGMQNITYGIALWIPYFGTGVDALDVYSFRSQMTPSVGTVWDLRRKDLDYALLRRLVQQWRRVAENYYGDFYPLTSYNPQDDAWMAWQFNRPEAGEGVVQAFRRPQCPYDSANLKLQGLDPNARYVLTNVDTPGTKTASGRDLMEQGLLVVLKNQPEAAIITYRRLGNS